MKCWAGWSTSWNQDARRNINNLRYAYDSTLLAENEKILKSLLMKVKEESEKADLNLSIQKMKIMASNSITSLQKDGETVRDFILGELQNHCRWWLQPWNEKTLLIDRKATTNIDSILKSRDITLLTKVCPVKDMVFPVVRWVVMWISMRVAL